MYVSSVHISTFDLTIIVILYPCSTWVFCLSIFLASRNCSTLEPLPFDFTPTRNYSCSTPRLYNFPATHGKCIYLHIFEIPGPQQKAGAAHELKPLSIPPVTSRNLWDLIFTSGSLGLTHNTLYLPQQQPGLPYHLGEDISRVGAGIQYIGIRAREMTLVNIALHQDHALSHYMQPHLPEDLIDPETGYVLMRCWRVGRVVCLLWKEMILLIKACTPQWWQWRNILRVHQKYKAAEED